MPFAPLGENCAHCGARLTYSSGGAGASYVHKERALSADGRWFCDSMSSCWEKARDSRLVLALHVAPFVPGGLSEVLCTSADGTEVARVPIALETKVRHLRTAITSQIPADRCLQFVLPDGCALSEEDDELPIAHLAQTSEAAHAWRDPEQPSSQGSRFAAKPRGQPAERRRRRGTLLALAALALGCVAATQARAFLSAPSAAVAQRNLPTSSGRHHARPMRGAGLATAAAADFAPGGDPGGGEPDVLEVLLGSGGQARLGRAAVYATALGAVTAFKIFTGWAQEPLGSAGAEGVCTDA